MPSIAWGVINQDWMFDIPFLSITYKPWRLFMVVGSLPALLSFIILTFLPESPKFVLNQGRPEETYQILVQMNRVNNGKKSVLEDFTIRKEVDSVESRQKAVEFKTDKSVTLLSSVWNQTVPLFKPPYLLPTILICAVQFIVFSTCQGFYVFFADILNRMSQNLDSFTGQRAMMCDVINMNKNKFNETMDQVSETCDSCVCVLSTD